MHNNYQQQCIEKSRPIWLSMARKAVSGVPINDIASEFGVTDVWVRRSAERINRGLQCMPRLTPWQFDRDYRSYAQMKKAPERWLSEIDKLAIFWGVGEASRLCSHEYDPVDLENDDAGRML